LDLDSETKPNNQRAVYKESIRPLVSKFFIEFMKNESLKGRSKRIRLEDIVVQKNGETKTIHRWSSRVIFPYNASVHGENGRYTSSLSVGGESGDSSENSTSENGDEERDANDSEIDE
jgi:hypothetical protein